MEKPHNEKWNADAMVHPDIKLFAFTYKNNNKPIFIIYKDNDKPLESFDLLPHDLFLTNNQ